jgi:acyl-homoserine lactone acylase PvdQ
MSITGNSPTDAVLDLLFKRVQAEKNKEIKEAIQNEEMKIQNWKALQSYNVDNIKSKAGYRKAATIPIALALAVEKKYGKEVWTNKALFKKVMKEPELSSFLTMPLNQI